MLRKLSILLPWQCIAAITFFVALHFLPSFALAQNATVGSANSTGSVNEGQMLPHNAPYIVPTLPTQSTTNGSQGKQSSPAKSSFTDASPGNATQPLPPTSPTQPAGTTVPAKNNTSHQSNKSVITEQNSQWIQLGAGMRQAYVGIHGGTAPLSLMQSANGTLFAFTGQTGNDFLHLLKGNVNNASQNKEQQVNATTVRNSTSQAAGDAPAVLNGTTNVTTATPPPSLTTSSEPNKKNNLPRTGAEKKEAGTPPSPPASTAKKSPKNSTATTHSKHPRTKVKGTPPLIMAKGNVASLPHSTEKLSPFGLGPAPEPLEKAASKRQPSPNRELRLGSYKAILRQ